MEPRQVVIFTAVELESRAIAGVLADRPTVHIVNIGIAAGHLPSELPGDNTVAIIMAGLAGALDPTLNVGDVILCDPQAIVPPSVKLRRGGIHTADQIAATPAEKAELFQQTGALVVDMESRLVRDFAAARHLPFVGIRAVSDSAAQSLDPSVLGLIDSMGQPKPMALTGALLRRPGLVPYLWRLGKNSKLAAEHLGQSVRLVVDQLLG